MRWIIFSIGIILFSFSLQHCSSSPTAEKNPAFDSSLFLRQSDHFDSLYANYSRTNNMTLLEKAVLVGDSIIACKLPADSIHRKKYIKALFYTADSYNTLGQYLQSGRHYEKLLDLMAAANIDNPSMEIYVRFNMANIYSRYGDYKKAITFLQKSREYFLKENDVEYAAAAALNEAIAWIDLDELAQADALMDSLLHWQVVSEKRKLKAWLHKATIASGRGNTAAAHQHLATAGNYLVQLPQNAEKEEITAEFKKISGTVLLQQDSLDKALQYFREASISLINSNPQWRRHRGFAKIYIQQGKTYQKKGLVDSALRCFSKALYMVCDTDSNNLLALPADSMLYAENTIAEVLDARADCLVKFKKEEDGNREHAIACYETAMKVDKILLQGFLFDESSLRLLEACRLRSAKAIDLCYQLINSPGQNKWQEIAFQFAETNKALLLQRKIIQNISRSNNGELDTSYNRLHLLQSRVMAAEIDLQRAKFKDGADSTISIKRKMLEADKLALADLDNSLSVKQPAYRSWARLNERELVDQLQQHILATDLAVMEYFLWDSSCYVFFIGFGEKGIQMLKLNSNVEVKINQFLDFFNDRDRILQQPQQYAGQAHSLFTQLVPVTIPNKVSQLLIIPDNNLFHLPFDALLYELPGNRDIPAFPYLLKRAAVSYAYSANVLIQQLQWNNESSKNKFCAVAPGFLQQQRGLASLPHSKDELLAMKKEFPAGEYLEGDEARLGNFKKAAEQSTILHLATHANSGNDSVTAQIEFADSALALYDLYSMNLPGNLAVISGCETAKGSVASAEGAMSIARALSYAGTRNTIASLWNTNDITASKIFSNFYKEAGSASFSRSLQKARLHYLQQASVQGASPYYWANLVYIGHPADGLRSKSSAWKWWIAGVLFVMAVFVWWKKKSV